MFGCSVSAGDLVGHHDGSVGDFNFSPAVSAGGGEGLSRRLLLLAHPGSRPGRPAAGGHGARCSVLHPPPELGARVSPPRLHFHRGLPRRAGHRQVYLTCMEASADFVVI